MSGDKDRVTVSAGHAGVSAEAARAPINVSHSSYGPKHAGPEPPEALVAQVVDRVMAQPSPPSVSTDRPSGPEWIEIVRAYRRTGVRRPKIGDVAEEMGIGERTLRTRLPPGVRWHGVHALVATED